MNNVCKFNYFNKLFVFLSAFVFLIFLRSFLWANDFAIVAKINNIVLTQYDLDNYSKIINSYFSNNINSKTTILNNLIETTLKNEAINREKIKFDEEEFKYFLTSLNSNNKISKKVKDSAAYEKVMKDSFMWNKLVETIIKPKVKISPLEVNDSLEYLSDNALRTRFNISQIILYENNTNLNAKVIADKLYSEITEKNNFETIVEKIPSNNKKNKGYIGWVDSMDIDKLIYDAIKNLEKGKITKPIYLGNSNSAYYIIVKLNDKKQEIVARNDDISRVSYFIYNQKLNLETKNYIDDLYKNSLIEVY